MKFHAISQAVANRYINYVCKKAQEKIGYWEEEVKANEQEIASYHAALEKINQELERMIEEHAIKSAWQKQSCDDLYNLGRILDDAQDTWTLNEDERTEQAAAYIERLKERKEELREYCNQLGKETLEMITYYDHLRDEERVIGTNLVIATRSIDTAWRKNILRDREDLIQKALHRVDGVAYVRVS